MNRMRVAAFVGAVCLAGLSVACSKDDATKDKPIAATTTSAASSNSITGDGTFAVGSQVQPGSYRTAVPDDSANCYYARLRDASGSLESVISNNNAAAGSQQIVEIKASDKYFKTEGCGKWTRV